MNRRLKQTWRWFGPNDLVTLKDIRQAGARGIVTALHNIPTGQAWPIEEIKRRKKIIEDEGLIWDVVESIPVHEKIKLGIDCSEYIENYKLSLRNLASCDIKIVTYNFMPVLDWTRTELDLKLEDGSTALFFERRAFAAFELFILERKGATDGYSRDEIERAREYYYQLNAEDQALLRKNIMAGLPGGTTASIDDLQEFRNKISTYESVDKIQLRRNLISFLEEIIPVAEDVGIQLAIHPDDPPYNLLGLPRVVSTADDLRFILNAVPSKSNGLCFCTGSLGVRPDNDLIRMIEEFGPKIHFVHLRSTTRNELGDFYEANHLEGDVDMYQVVKSLLQSLNSEQQCVPFRPDHGHKMLDDLNKLTNPGYSTIGRLRGLAELRGLEHAIVRELASKKHL